MPSALIHQLAQATERETAILKEKAEIARQDQIWRRVKQLLARWEHAHCVGDRCQTSCLKALSKEVERHTRKQAKAAKSLWRSQRTTVAAQRLADRMAAK